jgi:secreted trypsin-like serine protease
VQACEQIKKIVPIALDEHILGGQQADPGEFPHQVVLGYPDEFDAAKISYDCGGSLISKSFILTAGEWWW